MTWLRRKGPFELDDEEPLCKEIPLGWWSRPTGGFWAGNP